MTGLSASIFSRQFQRAQLRSCELMQVQRSSFSSEVLLSVNSVSELRVLCVSKELFAEA